MKLIIQRVSEAAVAVEGVCIGAIGAGCMVLVGCRTGDENRDADYLAKRLAALRIFHDHEGKMNLSITQTGGSVLLIPQFTLYADTRSGNRPGFQLAGDPETARGLFNHFVSSLRGILGDAKVSTGVFGAEMSVALVNEGPVTLELCSDKQPGRPSGRVGLVQKAAVVTPVGNEFAGDDFVMRKEVE